MKFFSKEQLFEIKGFQEYEMYCPTCQTTVAALYMFDEYTCMQCETVLG